MTPDDLRQIQRAAGLSDEQMAARLGCSKQHVTRMKMKPDKSGHRPILPDMAEKILKIGRE